MKAKKLFPDLSFKRLWDKIKELENKVGDGSDSEQNKNLNVRYNEETDMIEIFYNGVWNEWKQSLIQGSTLYKNGDEYIEVTQGWECIYSKGGTFTKKESEMEFNRTEAYQDVIASTQTPIDVTPYTKVTVEFYTATAVSTSTRVGRVAFNNELTSTNLEGNFDVFGGTGVLTKTIDISSVNGLYYVLMCAESVNNKLYVKSIKLHN